MAFCSNCGCKVGINAKYCSKCGAPIILDYEDNSVRRQVFEGTIHKCPNCGETIKSFTSICPSCGFEFRDVKVTSAVKEFSYKLEQLEKNRKPVSSFNKFLRSLNLGRADPVDGQIKSLIQNFTVPNTKEDVFEFMILAASSIDYDVFSRSRAYHQDIDPVELKSQKAIAKAWVAKVNQVYRKASLSFGEDPDFSDIREMYEDSKKSILRAKRQARRKNILMYLSLFFMIIIWVIMISALFSFARGEYHAGESTVKVFSAIGRGIRAFFVSIFGSFFE